MGFRMHEDLHAEAAAHVAGAHAKLGRADLEDHVGHDRPDHVHALRGQPQRRAVVLGVVLADGAARLHRVGDQPLVDELQLDHAIGLGEGRVRLAWSPMCQSNTMLSLMWSCTRGAPGCAASKVPTTCGRAS